MAQLRAIVDKLLTGVSSMFVPDGHISEALLPFIGVTQKTGKLAKYGHSHLRIETSIAGGRGSFRRVETITRSTASYEVEGHGLEAIVSEDDYRNVEAPYEAEVDEVMGLTTQLWVEKEKSLADTLADTNVLTQNVTLSGTSQFSDYDNSLPLTVAKTARAAVRAGCGKAPNAVWMSWAVADCLAYHPQLLHFLGFKDARPGGLTYPELAKALGVQKIFVADVSYNSANEGAADALADVWGKHLWFGVIPDSAVPRQVSMGYRIGYRGKSPRQVFKTPNFNPPGSTLCLVQDDYDFLISNAGAAYLVKSAVA